MGKKIDNNGFWLMRDNPVSKAGVFPYLGKQISKDLEPNKIYNVFRPIEELGSKETLESFDAVPFINEHEMLGDGFTPYDKRPAAGIMFNTKFKNGTMYADLRVYSEDLKDEIKSGKKELSLGYNCLYESSQGYYDGKQYDFIQRELRGNHIALVNNGRMGSDVKVYDKQITFDSICIVKDFINQNEKGNKNMNAEKIKLLAEVLKENGVGEEDVKKVIATFSEKMVELEKETEQAARSGELANEANKDEDNESIAEKEDKASKDNEEEKTEKSEPAKTEDEPVEKEEEKKAEEKKSTEDTMRAVMAEIEKKNKLVEALKSHIGSFACDGMTADEVAKYGCKKLNLQAGKGEHQAILRGFLEGKKRSNTSFSLDSAVRDVFSSGADKATERYLSGN